MSDILDDNAEPPEDEGVLDAYDTLDSDDLSADPLDTGYSPRERHPASEDYGVTAAEAARSEPLDARLARELPDLPASGESRSGRLVAEDDDLGASQPLYLGRDVGPDGGAASAEEAAIHEVFDLNDDSNDDFDEGAEEGDGFDDEDDDWRS